MSATRIEVGNAWQRRRQYLMPSRLTSSRRGLVLGAASKEAPMQDRDVSCLVQFLAERPYSAIMSLNS